MKKVISVLFLAVLFLCACGESKVNITPVTSGISFTAELTYYNECYEADVTVAKNGAADMEITSPDTIKGLTFHFGNDNVSAEYKGLEYKTDFSSMPECMCCAKLYEILRDTLKEYISVTSEGDSYCIFRESSDISYKLYLGATGLPISAEEKNSGFTVNFKNVTILK
ncbi:MAG: hypothetical protein UHO61_04285 [Acutalibacteraceae bacterium]|nr:hypothetical protein [Acutalibacteraceae bacterium]